MEGIRDKIAWDVKTLATLPFNVWVRRLEIDFIRPARGDQEIIITSFARAFSVPDAVIECLMTDAAGKELSRCLVTVAYIDKAENRSRDWPPDVASLFYEKESPGRAGCRGWRSVRELCSAKRGNQRHRGAV